MSESEEQAAFEAEEEVSSSLFEEFIAKNRIDMRAANEAAANKEKP